MLYGSGDCSWITGAPATAGMGAAPPPNAAAPAIVPTRGRVAAGEPVLAAPTAPTADRLAAGRLAAGRLAAANPAAGRASVTARVASRGRHPRRGIPAARHRAVLRRLGSMTLLIGTARRPHGAPPLTVSSQRGLAHNAMLAGCVLAQTLPSNS